MTRAGNKSIPDVASSDTVLVLGGGIAGIQAALDVANSGFRVVLVESGPAIGGRMAQLDKTFPTSDCSLCILSPRLVECGRHPGITLITCADLAGLEGGPGRFTARIRRRARYVDITTCTGCGACVATCPVRAPDDYQAGMAERPAIHIPYPQAVPNAAVIDAGRCLMLTKKKCGLCVKTCSVGAIRFDDHDREELFDVGAVILAPGGGTVDPALFAPLGYDRFANVVTSVEFERMLSASGPLCGHLTRPSDGKEPRRIAWLQCVGSRTVNDGCDNGYCSAVCCMYAIKQALIAREHADGDWDTTIFYMDMRSSGKDFERFYRRAEKEQGVRFVRGRIHTVNEDKATRDLVLRYAADNASVREETFDLVVLSVGLQISPETRQLGETLGLALDRHGFCVAPTFEDVATSLPGVFACGVFAGPKDIPESVMQASAAAAEAAALLSRARHASTATRASRPLRDVRGEPPRIGVVVCHCGTNIGGVVDVPSVAVYAATLPGVTIAEEKLYACSQDAQEQIKQTIRTRGLNRLVVASCSPRTHEPLFQESCLEAGLSPDLFEMVNIRDQDSWVHKDDPAAATDKAKDLVRMAVAKARRLRPLPRQTFGVTRAALIVGGGLAGMSAAVTVADQGFDVYLVEAADTLGGHALRSVWTLEGNDVRALVASLTGRVHSHPRIRVYKNATIGSVTGFVGNFAASIDTPDGSVDINFGAAIIATGAAEHRPAEYCYAAHPRAVTVTELEIQMAADVPAINCARSVVFIQCVGSRESARPWCSRVCCSHSVKLALRLKETDRAMNVFILYRDMRTAGRDEEFYKTAREKGVVFIRYDETSKPLVEPAGADALRVTAIDHVLGRPITVEADFLALATAIEPANNAPLSQLFKVPLNSDGFFLEAHVKLRPVDCAVDGVFLAGLAHGPKSSAEAITQARAAAGRAIITLTKEKIEAPAQVAEVAAALCKACGLCEALCAHGAIVVDAAKNTAVVNEALCKGCGVCASSCRSGAATVRGHTDAQIVAMVESAIRGRL